MSAIVSALIAVGIGLTVGLGWWGSYRGLAVRAGRRLLKPSSRKPGQGWLRRATFVLSGQLQLAIWLGLFLPGPVVHVCLSLFLPGWAALLGGILSVSGIAFEFFTGKHKINAIERTLLPVAVDRLLAHASVDYCLAALEHTLHSPDPVFRLAAAKGLGALGTAHALKLLATTTNDPDPEVRMASERASASIRRALGEGQPLSVKAMPVMFREHGFLLERMDHLVGHEFKSAARKLIELEQSMTEIVNSQMSLRNAFPELWCTKCNARTAEGRYSRWRYVHCKRCEDVLDIRLHVRTVTGRIGMRDDKPLEKRDIVLPIWQQDAQAAAFAEIDVLEICEDRAVNYDWAVNAVVERLANQWPDRSKPVEIRLTGKPVLSENAVRLLRSLNPSFQTNA